MLISYSYGNVTLHGHCNPSKHTYAFFIECNGSHKFVIFTVYINSQVVVSSFFVSDDDLFTWPRFLESRLNYPPISS